MSCNALSVIHYSLFTSLPEEPGPRKRYEDNGQSLVITDACKGTSDNNCTSDLYTVQCNVSNEHGYLYRGAALNVLRKYSLNSLVPEIVSTEILDK